jgi:ankyrin repeat protein
LFSQFFFFFFFFFFSCFSQGTPVSLRSWQQLTPLLYAAAHGHTDVVELLLDSGAKVSEVDIDLWSAAHHAAVSSLLG